MGKATKSISPLPFTDLEPHRFEDLVRQLIYDFRDWQKIETTGRLGSDEGFDIRAVEQVRSSVVEDGGSEESDREDRSEERTWKVRCTRCKRAGPKTVRSIVAGDLTDSPERPYGYLLVTSCDLSKGARDAFRKEVTEQGIQEYQLWGRSELEDRLFQPRNDHLLFAYFGISIQVRRRFLRTRVRSRLAVKRKLASVLGGFDSRTIHKSVLIRDPRHTEYPRVSSTEEFARDPLWRYWDFSAHDPPDHLRFVTRQHFAWVKLDTGEYDLLSDLDVAALNAADLHGLESDWADPKSLHQRYKRFWGKRVPPDQRGWVNEYRFIHYDRVLAIDELGDTCNKGPHLLIDYRNGVDPFEPRILRVVTDQHEMSWRRPDDLKHSKLFPDTIPEIEDWGGRGPEVRRR